MDIKVDLAKRINYGEFRSANTIKYIVIHYTGNDGDTDENNGAYFRNNAVECSAHYFVDSDSVTESVPPNYIAWHCGAIVYNHNHCRNFNSIGIELCDDKKDGSIYPSEKTIQNAIKLVELLMERYAIPKANIIRHYDVTGKICPAYWCGTVEKDAKWKSEFWDKIDVPKETLYRVQVGAYSKKENADAMKAKLKAAGFDAIIKCETKP